MGAVSHRRENVKPFDFKVTPHTASWVKALPLFVKRNLNLCFPHANNPTPWKCHDL